MNLILLGAPGSGKGVQAEIIINQYKLAHVSTGNILRKEIAEKSELGLEAKPYMDKGQLVPEELILRILGKELASERCSQGFILDGVPRTIVQAEALDKILAAQGKKIDRAVYLEVCEETLVRRLTNRRTCLACGKVFNLIGQPSKVEGICDACGGKLVQRDDDTETTVRKRFVEYENKTKPLLTYYAQKGLLFKVNGDQSKDVVFKLVSEELDGLSK